MISTTTSSNVDESKPPTPSAGIRPILARQMWPPCMLAMQGTSSQQHIPRICTEKQLTKTIVAGYLVVPQIQHVFFTRHALDFGLLGHAEFPGSNTAGGTTCRLIAGLTARIVGAPCSIHSMSQLIRVISLKKLWAWQSLFGLSWQIPGLCVAMLLLFLPGSPNAQSQPLKFYAFCILSVVRPFLHENSLRRIAHILMISSSYVSQAY